jgi:hypothetical protein
VFAALTPRGGRYERKVVLPGSRCNRREPYLWNFDLCSLTLANLRYRRMSLVRDYEAILDQQLANPAFETAFSLAPRPLGRELPPVPSLDERFDVVPCDPTQATAIAEARRGESYIIQGPPGTGKARRSPI